MTTFPQKNFDLSSFNTLSVPCVCEYFCEVHTRVELVEAILWSRSKQVKFYMLGGGSNALLPDYIDGLVIQLKLKGVSHKLEANTVFVTAAAGENWHDFVGITLKNQWFGLENLSLIPGSVGAAPIQNIGAYGVELADRFYSVTVLDLESLDEQTLYKKECKFSYRESVFKTDKGKKQYIILDVCFELSLKANICMEYPALQDQIVKNSPLSQNSSLAPTPQQVASAVISVRQSKLPDPDQMPNVGSFFKNPRIKLTEFEKLKKRFPAIPGYRDSGEDSDSKETYKIPAAWLIDQAGWKGRFVDGVGVHDKQALVLINPNNEPLSKVLALATLIQNDVSERFGITLAVEPQLLADKV